MAKGIILITKHFPFNQGETPAESYLENEIITLAEKTEKVFVIAAEALKTAKVTCSLPKNVEYAALQSCKGTSLKLKCLLKAVFGSFLKKAPEIYNEIQLRKPDVKQKLFLYYFAKRAEQKLGCIEDLINNKKLNLNDYDILYSYWFFDNVYTALMLKDKYSLIDYKAVSRAHGYDLYDYRNKLEYIPLRRYVLENIDSVYTCSDNGKDYLRKKYPDYKDKIKTSFLGSRDYGIQPYKREKSKLHIVSCSRVIPLKRVSRIVEGLAELENEEINLEWTHFGDGELFEEIKVLAEKNLKKTVFHLPGSTSNKDVMTKYSKMNIDVFVNVSENEGLPISIMEATSFGIPIIATDVGGTSEIVKDGINGFLLEKDFTNKDLKEKLIMLANISDEDYTSLRENSRKIYEEKFECVKNVEKFLTEIG